MNWPRLTLEGLKKRLFVRRGPKGYLLNKAECTGCTKCMIKCPVDAIDISLFRVSSTEIRNWRTPKGFQIENGVEKFFLDRSRCVNCDLCVDVCPTKALTVEPWQSDISERTLDLRTNMLEKRRMR